MLFLGNADYRYCWHSFKMMSALCIVCNTCVLCDGNNELLARSLFTNYMIIVLQFANSFDESFDGDFDLNVTEDDIIKSLKKEFQLSQSDVSSIISESSEHRQSVKVHILTCIVLGGLLKLDTHALQCSVSNFNTLQHYNTCTCGGCLNST